MGLIIIKFVHILASIIWVGSVLTINMISIRLISTNDKKGLSFFFSQEEFIGKTVIAPSAILTLITGIIMSLLWFGWPFWTIWGLIVVVLTGLAGSTIIPKQSKKLIHLVINEGSNHIKLQSLKNKFLILVIVLLILLLSAVGAMVFKPVL